MKLTRINPAKIEGGDRIGDIPDMGDLRLKVRGLNNADFRRKQQELIAAVPRGERRKGRIDPTTMDGITAQCLAATVLLDWQNLEGEDGKPVPYSAEQARAYLTDPALRSFVDAVVYAASIVGDDDAPAQNTAGAAARA